jgi:UDP-glucose 4-epimerase
LARIIAERRDKIQRLLLSGRTGENEVWDSRVARKGRARLGSQEPGVLVTGGAGFIASHVAAAYLLEGRRITVLDDLSTGFRSRVPSGAAFVEGSLNSADLVGILRDGRISVVNHHAAHVDLRASVKDPVHDAEVNVLGSIRLFEACREAGVRKIIFSSTGGAIYGEPRGPSADESHPTDPVSPYGVAKLSVEKYLHYYRVEHGFQTIVLRYANIYGPGQNGKGEAGAVAIFTEAMLAGKTPHIHGDGEQTRDFVYVMDCVEANRRALELEGSGVWNVGTGIETSVNRLAEMISRAVGFEPPILHDAAAAGEQRRSVLDGRKLLGDFGLAGYTPLESGIAATVAWFRTRREA